MRHKTSLNEMSPSKPARLNGQKAGESILVVSGAGAPQRVRKERIRTEVYFRLFAIISFLFVFLPREVFCETGEETNTEYRLSTEEPDTLSYCEYLLEKLEDTTYMFSYKEIMILKECIDSVGNTGIQLNLFEPEAASYERGTCGDNDIRDVYLGIALAISFDGIRVLPYFTEGSKQASIFEEVVLNFPRFNGHPGISFSELSLEIEGQSYDLLQDSIVPWNCTVGADRVVDFITKGKITGLNIVRGILPFRVKNNAALSSAAIYRAPDSTWYIPSAGFNPASAYCEGAVLSEADKLPSGAGGYVHILYGNAEKILQKPFVFVEGLDLSLEQKCDPYYNKTVRCGGVGWDTFITGLYENPHDEDVLQLSPQMITTLLDQGYDVMFVDFEDGATWIQHNGELIISLIEKINAVKTGGAENIIVGASMGGIVSRWALTTMEERGQKPCSAVYVSFDAPQKGASMPLGLQALAYQLTLHEQPDYELWDVLNRPAPQQLLVNHFNRAFGDHYNCIRTKFAQELKDLGYPKTMKNAAIACASGVGTPVTGAAPPNNGNDMLFKAQVDAGCLGFDLRILTMASDRTEGNLLEFPCQSGISRDNLVYYAAMPSTQDQYAVGLPKRYSQVSLQSTLTPGMYRFRVEEQTRTDNTVVRDNYITYPHSLEHWDTAPGCYRTDFPGLLSRTLRERDRRMNVPIGENFTFMPVISLLDIDTDDLYFDVENNIYSPVNVNKALSPFDLMYYTEDVNLQHVEITPGIIAFIMDNVLQDSTDTPPAVLEERYNYAALTQYNIPSTVINNGGELVINGAGNAAYGGLDNSESENYILRTAGCGPVAVEVNARGKLTVGERAGYRGILTVSPGHTLHVKELGELRVSEWSQLHIDTGAVLILDGGAIVELNTQGSIHVRGTLVLDGDVDVLSGGAIHLYEGATLIANGNKLTLRGNYSGISYPYAHLTYAKLLVLEEGAELSVSDYTVELHEGIVEYKKEGSAVLIGSDGKLKAEKVVFHSLETLTAASTWPYTLSGVTGIRAERGGLQLKKCTFKGFLTAVALNQAKLPGGVIEEVDFEGNVVSLAAYDQGDLYLQSCNFEEGLAYINYPNSRLFQDHAKAVVLQNANLYIRLTKIRNYAYGYGIYAPSETAGWKNNIFVTNCSEISHNKYGVYIDGGLGSGELEPDWGIFHMNRSTLTGNTEVGVRGTDVLLSIDSYSGGGNTLLGCNAGLDFQPLTDDPVCTLFDICYKYRQPEYILARGNYWGVQTNPLAEFPRRSLRKAVHPLAHCSVNVPLVWSPGLTFPPVFTHAECNGQGHEVGNIAPPAYRGYDDAAKRSVFADSYGRQIDGDGEGALRGWQELSLRGAQEGSPAHYYSEMASVFSPARVPVMPRSTMTGGPAERRNLLRHYPNPVGEVLHVVLAEGEWDITLYHPDGTKVTEMRTPGGERSIDCSRVAPGIYLMELKNEEMQEREVIRLIKM